MEYKAVEFKNVANINKSDLRKKSVLIPISDNTYQFKISGVGQQAIKLEKYFYYSEIINSVQDGNKNGLEYLIEQIIIDPNMEKVPCLDSSQELKLRATSNKQALKRMSLEVFVGTKLYEFRIAGIGGRSVKIEIYIGYEDIANELNKGNDLTLEFILKEVLVGNEIDYSIFENIDYENYTSDDDLKENEDNEDKSIVIDKLSSKESEELISNIEGIQKLIFDSIDDIDSDIFTVNDVLEQDRIKSYAVQGQSFEPIVIKNINELIDLGIISNGNNDDYYKLW